MEYTQGRIRVLVVEDETVVSEDLQQRLRAMGYDIAGAADTAADAIRAAELSAPHVALMDIMLHGRPEGIDAAEHLRGQLDIPVIFLTAHSDSATLRRAGQADPAGYIVKPFDDAQLRAAINLAPTRHEMERKARRVARWLTATLTSIGDAVIATNNKAEILILNPAAEKLTGWTQEEAVQKPFKEVVRLVSHDTRAPLEDPATRALREGLTIRIDPNTLLLTRSGEERYVDDSASPIADEAGNVLGAVVVIVDATDRLATQGRVTDLARQLGGLLAQKERNQQINTELEQFATAVSHDLRVPLNAIAGFSHLLSERHRERLDSSGQKFLDHVQKSAQQMISMTEDYLRFVGLMQGEDLSLSTVRLQALAQEVFANLMSAPGQRPVRFVCTALPAVSGDEALLRQVFVSLLGNAVKYSSKCAQPVVEVGMTAPAEGTHEFHTLFVRDNGAGLDVANAKTLFEPFQRFHNAFQFSGTGVGLAIAKRIVERHGGRIWVTSQPDAGATFFFALPDKAGVAAVPA